MIEPANETVQPVEDGVEINIPLPVEEKQEVESVTTISEKVKDMPQTYVEDTFDINNSAGNQYQETVIKNDVKVKTKKFITEEELLKSFKFGVKLDRYKSRIEYHKTFKEVLDLTQFSKLNKTYYIDDTTDEIDILIREIVKHFRKRLTKISLSYADYQKIDLFFKSLQSIYNRFNHGENAIKDDLKVELEKLVGMERFIKLNFFVKY